MFVLGSLIAILVASRGALVVGYSFGFASGTTGGGSAAQAVPTSVAELKSWLSDDTPRNILLDRTYDFTDTEGSVTGTGCKPWTCAPNPQLAINLNNWCPPSAAKVQVTYKKAGISGLVVGSNKTILGKGTSGWIKGKGLKLSGSKNVIIQNIRISDINPQFVWGGDAINLAGATNVWIDHNDFKDVGRQFIVSHFDPNINITISNNFFDGRANYTAECNQHHYWAFLMLGEDDEITFARNYVYHTSGRGPHIGGKSGNRKQTLHMYNNYFNDIIGHALDADVGSRVLVEGNYFSKASLNKLHSVKSPSTGNTKGAVFAATSPLMAEQCSEKIKRKCVLNILNECGTLKNVAKEGIVAQFTASAVEGASIMDASAVPGYVLKNAGTGKINRALL